MDYLKHFIDKRVFFYLNAKFYRAKGSLFEPVNDSEFVSCLLPVVIVAREHLKELKKRYPVTDKSDLKGVLTSETQAHSVVQVDEIEDNKTPVKFWHADEGLFERFPDKLFLWLPETFLHDGFNSGELKKIERCGKSLFSINDKNQNYSASCQGAFSSADYFLMSVGLSQTEVNTIGESAYVDYLSQSLLRLSPVKLKALFKAQLLPQKLLRKFNWLSLATGAAIGTVLYFASQFLLLQVKSSAIENEIATIDIKSHVKQKQDILDKRKAFEVFANQDFQEPIEYQLWHFLGLIMNEDISVIRIRKTENGVWLRLQSKVATDSLSKIKKIEFVDSASLVNAVQNVRGSQRFNMEVKFKAVKSLSNNEAANE